MMMNKQIITFFLGLWLGSILGVAYTGYTLADYVDKQCIANNEIKTYNGVYQCKQPMTNKEVVIK